MRRAHAMEGVREVHTGSDWPSDPRSRSCYMGEPASHIAHKAHLLAQ